MSESEIEKQIREGGYERKPVIGAGASKDAVTGWWKRWALFENATYFDGMREAACRFADWGLSGQPVVGPERVPLELILSDISECEEKAKRGEIHVAPSELVPVPVNELPAEVGEVRDESGNVIGQMRREDFGKLVRPFTEG